jgi:hypothetical protein
MYSLEDGPVSNKGYYDVPINNQYSNIEYRNTPVITNEYQVNKKINLTVNDNRDDYIVYEQPTRPASSLYLESDMQTPYYSNNVPLKKKERIEL